MGTSIYMIYGEALLLQKVSALEWLEVTKPFWYLKAWVPSCTVIVSHKEYEPRYLITELQYEIDDPIKSTNNSRILVFISPGSIPHCLKFTSYHGSPGYVWHGTLAHKMIYIIQSKFPPWSENIVIFDSYISTPLKLVFDGPLRPWQSNGKFANAYRHKYISVFSTT